MYRLAVLIVLMFELGNAYRLQRRESLFEVSASDLSSVAGQLLRPSADKRANKETSKRPTYSERQAAQLMLRNVVNSLKEVGHGRAGRSKKFDARVKNSPLGAGLMQSMDILQHRYREKQLISQLANNEDFLARVGR